MRCLYCGKELWLFRDLRDRDFCSAAHRNKYHARVRQALLQLPQDEPRPVRLAGWDRRGMSLHAPAPAARLLSVFARRQNGPSLPSAAFLEPTPLAGQSFRSPFRMCEVALEQAPEWAAPAWVQDATLSALPCQPAGPALAAAAVRPLAVSLAAPPRRQSSGPRLIQTAASGCDALPPLAAAGFRSFAATAAPAVGPADGAPPRLRLASTPLASPSRIQAPALAAAASGSGIPRPGALPAAVAAAPAAVALRRPALDPAAVRAAGLPALRLAPDCAGFAAAPRKSVAPASPAGFVAFRGPSTERDTVTPAVLLPAPAAAPAAATGLASAGMRPLAAVAAAPRAIGPASAPAAAPSAPTGVPALVHAISSARLPWAPARPGAGLHVPGAVEIPGAAPLAPHPAVAMPRRLLLAAPAPLSRTRPLPRPEPSVQPAILRSLESPAAVPAPRIAMMTALPAPALPQAGLAAEACSAAPSAASVRSATQPTAAALALQGPRASDALATGMAAAAFRKLELPALSAGPAAPLAGAEPASAPAALALPGAPDASTRRVPRPAAPMTGRLLARSVQGDAPQFPVASQWAAVDHDRALPAVRLATLPPHLWEAICKDWRSHQVILHRPAGETEPGLRAGRRWVQNWQRSAPLYQKALAACLLLGAVVWGGTSSAAAGSWLAERRVEWHAALRHRASSESTDNFQAGLSQWRGAADWTQTWSVSKEGFVRPGKMALYAPSTNLTDYRLEFLAQVEHKSVAWAFRAEDPANYYAVKFTITQPGPRPLAAVIRYPVIDGKRGRAVQTPVPLIVQNDMAYRMQLDVSGRQFRASIDGQVVDSWSDDRLTQGGVGFFADNGERARLYWVKVSHNTDLLGRICAALSSNDTAVSVILPLAPTPIAYLRGAGQPFGAGPATRLWLPAAPPRHASPAQHSSTNSARPGRHQEV